MNWFTADTHFGHANIIKYCNRPFKTAQEMDRTMVKNWQAVVSPQDHVFHLGDFGIKKPDYLHRLLQQLPGKLHYITGNHDSARVLSVIEPRAVWVRDIWHSKLSHQGKSVNLTLCHYPMLSWSKSHHGALQLFGHVHDNFKFGVGKSLNVGVDQWNFTPVSFEKVIQVLEDRKKGGHDEVTQLS